MDDIILYTIGCPACNILEKKMDDAGLIYSKITDEKVMEEKGFKMLPVVQINNTLFTFAEMVQLLKGGTINGN